MTNTTDTFEGMEATALVAHLEAGIAKLRAITNDPVSIKLSEIIDIELSPSTEGERIYIGRKGWGDTSVNYIDRGLLLDVYSADQTEAIHSVFCPKKDIEKFEDAKKAKIQEFIDLLTRADSAEVSSSPLLTSWNTAPLTGEPDNEIIHFTWVDEDGSYSVTFTETGIENGKWVGGSFICIDSEGDENAIRLHRHIAIAPTLVTAG
nr:hypothetical protein [Comamonas testosteroni]